MPAKAASARTRKAARPARATAPKASGPTASKSATKGEVGAWLRGLPDWRGTTLARVRALVRDAVPDVVEEVKWRKPSNAMRGVPVWSKDGLICTGEPYKDKVKLTFARGASLPDPAHLFNAQDTGATRRAIDLREGDALDPDAFRALVRAAVAVNMGGA